MPIKIINDGWNSTLCWPSQACIYDVQSSHCECCFSSWCSPKNVSAEKYFISFVIFVQSVFAIRAVICVFIFVVIRILQTCKVSKGQMKVKCGSRKWTVTENGNIKLNPSKCLNVVCLQQKCACFKYSNTYFFFNDDDEDDFFFFFFTDSEYFVKNNSLRNECTVLFTFE